MLELIIITHSRERALINSLNLIILLRIIEYLYFIFLFRNINDLFLLNFAYLDKSFALYFEDRARFDLFEIRNSSY